MKKYTQLIWIWILTLGLCACGTDNTDVLKTDADNTNTENFTEENNSLVNEDVTVNENMDEENDNAPLYRIYDGNDTVPNCEDYGTLETRRQEYLQDSGAVYYYYEIDEFYFGEDFDESLNETLRQYYADWEEVYLEDADSYDGDMIYEIPNDSMQATYNYLHLVNMTYVGDDYVSFLFNNIADLGGAHPYSQFDGLILDRTTGEEVSFKEFLPSLEEEAVWNGVSKCMGVDGELWIEDADFYITEEDVVFFYRMPNYWDDVAVKREK